MRNRILVALVGVPLLLLVLLVLPPIYTPVFISILAMIASYEVNRVLKVTQIRIQVYSILLADTIPFWVYYGEGQLPALCAMLLYIGHGAATGEIEKRVSGIHPEGASHDVKQFAGDNLLTELVILKRKLVEQLVGIVGGQLHGYITGSMF